MTMIPLGPYTAPNGDVIDGMLSITAANVLDGVTWEVLRANVTVAQAHSIGWSQFYQGGQLTFDGDAFSLATGAYLGYYTRYAGSASPPMDFLKLRAMPDCLQIDVGITQLASWNPIFSEEYLIPLAAARVNPSIPEPATLTLASVALSVAMLAWAVVARRKRRAYG